MKVARNEKRKKLLGFSFYINIGNSEGFLWNLNLSANCLFWRCVYLLPFGVVVGIIVEVVDSVVVDVDG